MTMSDLSAQELCQLTQSVFPRLEQDKNLAILLDIPRYCEDDNEEWQKRRQIAVDWRNSMASALDLGVSLIAYADVGSNNAELPEQGYLLEGSLPNTVEQMAQFGEPVSFAQIFSSNQIFLTLSEYSATAPLKIAARHYGFRAATMGGFSAKMIPALRLDYDLISRRVAMLKDKLDAAQSAEVVFTVANSEYRVLFDLRFRFAHPSSGRFPNSGDVGNLPSGESYIVPYEGELEATSNSYGTIPVQFGKEVVFYQIEENHVYGIEAGGEYAERERRYLAAEPAYGNIAELGFGVLGDFGLSPIGEILLDEKLGFHIAFGRSDHFGGSVGPKNFTSPDKVVHIDRVYIPETQPQITVKAISLDGTPLMSMGKYLCFE